ncbi:DUF6691 family protein [Candidatus Berkiella aquae]|uniref:Transporter component n=1 Tax=Candidatus Berkiella aquae TaxID=295108 RepID=A0A0Q9YLG3_9GAMM|nr:DUF6691 family protein [Candidatus Berkiella aquae]MCS5711481.1 hypothetical protein [Candidatus Berkiella aquae]
MIKLFSFISGFIFGIGLLISGMANPSKVLGFLDITGIWDPSLAFVMIGAIIIGFFAFNYAKRVKKTITGEAIKLSTTQKIDKKLIFGSILFGIGWGLVGFCPGPAIVALGAAKLKALYFTGAMLIGMLFYELFQTKSFLKY